jgi:probable rRNA maturation factor
LLGRSGIVTLLQQDCIQILILIPQESRTVPSFFPVNDAIMKTSPQTDPIMQVDVCIQVNPSDRAMGDGSDQSSCVTDSAFSQWHEGSWLHIPWTGWFLVWVNHLQPSLSPIHAYELTLRLTSDEEIQQLNAHYRDMDKPTDVLAFATIDADTHLPAEMYATQPYYLGDIIISLETASLQADSARHSLSYELAWLASHGLLHLLGWHHPDEESLQRMLDKQYGLLDRLSSCS